MKNKSTYIMLGVGLLLQLITFIITKDTWLAFISGIAGVVSVVFCSERRMSYYIWSFIQIITFSIICWNEQLWGKMIENLFYLITLFIGVYVWKKNISWWNNKVTTRSIPDWSCWKPGIYMVAFVGFLILYFIFDITNDPYPALDAASTSFALTAQVLMVLRYKENWIMWFITDVICILLFTVTENWCMAIQYVFWMINTLYGYIQWDKGIKG